MLRNEINEQDKWDLTTLFPNFEKWEASFQAAQEEIGQEHVLVLDMPSLGAEDFALYGERVPAAFYRLGSLKEGEMAWPLHSGYFAPDENAMRTGIRVLAAAALRFLESE